MNSDEPTRKERLTKIWKTFAFYESKLSIEFIADLTHLTEAQVEFILASHRETYERIISGRISKLEKDSDERL